MLLRVQLRNWKIAQCSCVSNELSQTALHISAKNSSCAAASGLHVENVQQERGHWAIVMQIEEWKRETRDLEKEKSEGGIIFFSITGLNWFV